MSDGDLSGDAEAPGLDVGTKDPGPRTEDGQQCGTCRALDAYAGVAKLADAQDLKS